MRRDTRELMKLQKLQLNLAPYGMAICKESGNILYCNRPMEHLLRLSQDHFPKKAEELRVLIGQRLSLPDDNTIWEIVAVKDNDAGTFTEDESIEPEHEQTCMFIALNVSRLAETESRKDQLLRKRDELNEKKAAGEKSVAAVISLSDELAARQAWYDGLSVI